MGIVIKTGVNILHNLPYEGISVTVSKDTSGTVEENGRKILPAGTLLAGIGGSFFEDKSRLVEKVDGSGVVDGISLNDVDVTERDAEVSLVFRGTVRTERVNGGEVSDAVKEQLHLVKFVKGL